LTPTDVAVVVAIIANHLLALVGLARLWDVKAHGVQVPNVSTADQARSAVQACRYHPLGMRGSSNPYVRANDYGAGEFREYMKWANDQSLLVIQVEGVEGVRNLPFILEVPGVDVVWMAPYDLSQSMGFRVRWIIPESLKK